jgi:hypothetical protein
MQQQFDAENLPIQIIGINESGLEFANESMTQGRDLPWLQDLEEIDVWTQWDVTYRDVRILDGEHNLRYTYNLSNNNLQDPAKFEELRAVFEGLLPSD